MNDYRRGANRNQAVQQTPLGSRAVGGAPGKGPGIQPVAIKNGFFSDRPPRAVRFFTRQFSAPFPHNIGLYTSPSGLTVIAQKQRVSLGKFVIPRSEMLVISDIRFDVFQDSGTGGVIGVPPGSLQGVVSFDFKINGRSMVDQVSPGGQGSFGVGGAPTNIGEVPATFTELPPTNTQEQLDAVGGSFAERYGQDGKFTVYGRPSEVVEGAFVVLGAPDVDLRSVSFSVTGYLLSDTVLKETLGFAP